MTTERPDRASVVLWTKTIFKGWDLWISLVAGVATYVAVSGRQDVDGGGLLVGLGTACGAIAATTFIAERWIHDKTTDTSYGEILGAIDPEARALLLPYVTTTFVAVAAFVVNILVSASIATLEPPIRDLLYAVSAWLTAWTIFGFLGVMQITRRHMRRMRRVETIRREAARDRRTGRGSQDRNGRDPE